MEKDLLGYLLKALDADEHAAVEAYLRTHPEAHTRLEALRHTLEPLAWDAPEAPPSGLACKTLALIAPAEVASSTAAAGWHVLQPGRRLVEMLVAVAAAVVVAGIFTVWVVRTRQQQPG